MSWDTWHSGSTSAHQSPGRPNPLAAIVPCAGRKPPLQVAPYALSSLLPSRPGKRENSAGLSFLSPLRSALTNNCSGENAHLGEDKQIPQFVAFLRRSETSLLSLENRRLRGLSASWAIYENIHTALTRYLSKPQITTQTKDGLQTACLCIFLYITRPVMQVPQGTTQMNSHHCLLCESPTLAHPSEI